MEIKEDLKYLESHEWYKKEGSIGMVGISDYAQGEMGDVGKGGRNKRGPLGFA